MPGGRPLVRRAGGCPRPAPMNRIGSEFIHAGIRHPDNPRKTGAARFIPTCGARFHRTRFRIPEQQLFGVQPEFHAPRPARGDRPETFGFGVGHVRGVGRPRLRLGAAVGNLAAVVPDRPAGRLSVDLILCFFSCFFSYFTQKLFSCSTGISFVSIQSMVIN